MKLERLHYADMCHIRHRIYQEIQKGDIHKGIQLYNHYFANRTYEHPRKYHLVYRVRLKIYRYLWKVYYQDKMENERIEPIIVAKRME